MNKINVTLIGLVIISFIVSFYVYSQTPENIATHWNGNGEVDGHMNKELGLFLIPGMLIGLVLLFKVIPKIDPLKENIEKFKQHYEGLIVVITAFMLFVHLQIVLWNIGIQISPNSTMPIGIGLLFLYLGFILDKTKRNWFIGIRTPWTLSSDSVWDKTHKIGAKLFKVAGVIALLGILFKEYSVYLIVGPALLIAGYTIVYSYLEHKKELKEMKK